MSWKADNYSQFWNKPLEYGFSHKLGTVLSKNKNQVTELDHADENEENVVLPQVYDFRQDPDVKDYLRSNSIRDQCECGASWAFSTIGQC